MKFSFKTRAQRCSKVQVPDRVGVHQQVLGNLAGPGLRVGQVQAAFGGQRGQLREHGWLTARRSPNHSNLRKLVKGPGGLRGVQPQVTHPRALSSPFAGRRAAGPRVGVAKRLRTFLQVRSQA